MNTRKSTSSIGKIDSVVSMNTFHQDTGGKWLNFFQAINPLGIIAESYAKKLAYKLEIKRFEGEVLRIKKQAEIAHNAINTSFRLQMAHLANRRMEMMAFYETLNQELSRIHAERQTILQMAQHAQMLAMKPETSLEDKTIHNEMALALLRELPNLNRQAGRQLEQAKQSLPQVNLQKLID